MGIGGETEVDKKSMRADLHTWGYIGLQHKWLREQGFEKTRIAPFLADAAVRNGLEILVVTSNTPDGSPIKPRGVHDRFHRLFGGPVARAELYHQDWEVEPLDPLGLPNVVELKKDGATLYAVNSQMVWMEEGGQRCEHLVIGTNRSPTKRSIEDTLDWGRAGEDDAILTHIALNPFVPAKFPVPPALLKGLTHRYDAVIAHHAKHRFSRVGAFILPEGIVQGHTREADKMVTEEPIVGSTNMDLPGIAVSGAHWPSEVGRMSVDLHGVLDVDTEEKFLASLRDCVGSYCFTWQGKPVSLASYWRFATTFKRGLRRMEREGRDW